MLHIRNASLSFSRINSVTMLTIKLAQLQTSASKGRPEAVTSRTDTSSGVVVVVVVRSVHSFVQSSVGRDAVRRIVYSACVCVFLPRLCSFR